MTNRELFDKVVAHLRAQNAKAQNQNYACMYRATDGKKCAVGCLILDKHYSPDLEGKGIWWLAVQDSLRASGVADSQVELVQSLQNVHDNFQVGQWPSELARVAAQYNLAPPAPPAAL